MIFLNRILRQHLPDPMTVSESQNTKDFPNRILRQHLTDPAIHRYTLGFKGLAPIDFTVTFTCTIQDKTTFWAK